MPNSFAVLDDSEDEAPKSKVAPASKKSGSDSSKKVAPASTPDPKNKPKNNGRNTKDGPRGRPPARDGKRTYDRRSGTGRGKEIKKGGGGARNWGSDKNEAKKMEGSINEEEVVAPVVTEGAEAPVEVTVEEVEPPVVDNTISYADYMASKGDKEQVSLRETTNEFAGVTAAAKVEEKSFMSMGVAKKKKEKKQIEAKKIIDVGFRSRKINTEGEGRGDRGEGRGDRGEGRGGDRRDSRGGRGDRRDGGRGGRGGRGDRKGGRGAGGRGPKSSSSTKKPQGLNVQDESAFPSL